MLFRFPCVCLYKPTMVNKYTNKQHPQRKGDGKSKFTFVDISLYIINPFNLFGPITDIILTNFPHLKCLYLIVFIGVSAIIWKSGGDEMRCATVMRKIHTRRIYTGCPNKNSALFLTLLEIGLNNCHSRHFRIGYQKNNNA